MKYSILLLAIITLSCSPQKEKNGITLSKIKLETLEGKTIDLSAYEGKTIFLNFWATWCGPCLQEMPSIEKTMNELNDPGIIFLFASEEEVDRIKNFKETRKFNFEYVRVLNTMELNILALPTTFIFNPNGDLIFNELGYRDWSTDQNKKLIQGKLTQ